MSPLGVYFLARVLAAQAPPPGPEGLMWVLYLALAVAAAVLAVAARIAPGGAGPIAAQARCVTRAGPGRRRRRVAAPVTA